MFAHEIFVVISRILAAILLIVFFVVVVKFAKNVNSAYDMNTGELDTSVKAAARFDSWSNKIGTTINGYLVEFTGRDGTNSESSD